jgi:beta-galactosidase GanA
MPPPAASAQPPDDGLKRIIGVRGVLSRWAGTISRPQHQSVGAARVRLCSVLVPTSSSTGLQVTESGFRRDGRPHQVVSAAMHYARVHPDLWSDRLHRLAAMGVNTVETYVMWNFHQPAEATVDFAGWRDVAADRKGITDSVRLDYQHLFDWEIRSLPLDDVAALPWSTGGRAAAGPTLHRAELLIGAPADGWIALPGWEKGCVWLNGFQLGRYWSIGPQRALYAPAPLWREGSNEVIVLELDRPGDAVELRDQPDLG